MAFVSRIRGENSGSLVATGVFLGSHTELNTRRKGIADLRVALEDRESVVWRPVQGLVRTHSSGLGAPSMHVGSVSPAWLCRPVGRIKETLMAETGTPEEILLNFRAPCGCADGSCSPAETMGRACREGQGHGWALAQVLTQTDSLPSQCLSFLLFKMGLTVLTLRAKGRLRWVEYFGRPACSGCGLPARPSHQKPRRKGWRGSGVLGEQKVQL